jgi:hypothetical protein
MFARHLLAGWPKTEVRSQKTEVRGQPCSSVFCLLVSVFCLLVPGTAESAAPARVEVVARVYNTARVAPPISDVALATATRLMTAGAIDVAWRNCDLADACTTVPLREFVIRLVRSREPTTDGSPFVLGEASVDVSQRAGVLATIYVDRVERMAKLSEADTSALLGRAIAHELGHLLLATNAHSSRGLMRAQWSPRDIRGNQIADWVLSREDVAAIRRRLQ